MKWKNKQAPNILPWWKHDCPDCPDIHGKAAPVGCYEESALIPFGYDCWGDVDTSMWWSSWDPMFEEISNLEWVGLRVKGWVGSWVGSLLSEHGLAKESEAGALAPTWPTTDYESFFLICLIDLSFPSYVFLISFLFISIFLIYSFFLYYLLFSIWFISYFFLMSLFIA